MSDIQHDNTLTLFSSWLDDDKQLKLSESSMKTHRLFVLSEEGDSSVSGQNTISTGTLAPQESEQGKILDDAIARGDKNDIAKVLASSTGNAVSSILGLSQSRSGWNPLEPDKESNEKGFTLFIESLLKVPYFNTTQAESTTVHYEEENYDSLINKVVDLYDGVEERDKSKIKSSIVNLAKACTSRVNTQNTKTLFVQNTLNAYNKNIVVQLQQTFMMMERSHSSGKGAPKDKYKTEISVKVLELTFQGNIWTKDAAEKLANKFAKSWDDWLDDTSTPESDNAKNINFCFN
ncbi:hypothetical protein ACFFL1_03750 [Samsonia erythrinae]|uniref:Uncharacterized protein n=1 Tax=Samsonia erythrinae TaxID=160434 RepID=A0A4R3VU13_9GAMM|nr:hypothetical protein [Samsonia erythrinae]TCV08886.1 hypothetical protein EDC54_101403 [Samsonia erythrinae]